MVGAATYRIGPGDLFLPGDLKADADTLASQMEALDAQTNGAAGLPRDLVNAWVLFQGDWAAFYYAHFDGVLDEWLTAANDSNRDQLLQFETRFQKIVDGFRAAGLAVAGTDVEPVDPEKRPGLLDKLGLGSGGAAFAIWGAILLIVLIIAMGFSR